MIHLWIDWDKFSEGTEGCCQTNANSSPFAQPKVLSGNEEAAPLGESGGAVGLVVWSRRETAFLVEVVVAETDPNFGQRRRASDFALG